MTPRSVLCDAFRMIPPERRADAASRLRKAFQTLLGARALLRTEPPCRDDAVNRASVAALQAARSLVDSQWAKESQPGWDPNWRPGMKQPGQAKDPYSIAVLQKLLSRFESLARSLSLPPDFTDYVRTQVEYGLEADSGEAPEYDDDEVRAAIDTAEMLILTVADQIGLGPELRAAHKQQEPVQTIAPPAASAVLPSGTP